MIEDAAMKASPTTRDLLRSAVRVLSMGPTQGEVRAILPREPQPVPRQRLGRIRLWAVRTAGYIACTLGTHGMSAMPAEPAAGATRVLKPGVGFAGASGLCAKRYRFDVDRRRAYHEQA